MASMRQEAQGVLDVARDGIGWIVVWKDGRGWCCMDFWPNYDDADNTYSFGDFELDQLRHVVAIDPRAVIVNGYYYNLGDSGALTRDDLSNALRRHYDNGTNLVVGVLGEEATA